MWRRVGPVGLILVAVLGLLVAASTVRRAGAPEDPPTRVDVDVVGDSLVTQASTVLGGRLAAAGLVARIAERPAQDLGSTFVRRRLAAVRLRPRARVLVVATAANDALRQDALARVVGGAAAEEAYAALVERVLAPFADRCVVVVGARERISALYHPASAAAVNRVLRRATAGRGDRVLVEWAALSHPLPEGWFAADLLHFAPDPHIPAVGSRSASAYADAIVDGVRRCAGSGSR